MTRARLAAAYIGLTLAVASVYVMGLLLALADFPSWEAYSLGAMHGAALVTLGCTPAVYRVLRGRGR